MPIARVQACLGEKKSGHGACGCAGKGQRQPSTREAGAGVPCAYGGRGRAACVGWQLLARLKQRARPIGSLGRWPVHARPGA